MKGWWLGLALIASQAAAQDYRLVLRPARDNLPNVMAALDPQAAIERSQQSLNPFLYECVAFLQIRSAADDTVAFTRDSATMLRRDAVWIAPAGDLTKRRRPRLVSLRAGGRTLMVSLDPGDSRAAYVVGIDSAAVIARGAAATVRSLVSESFTIPAGELEQCGRVPAVNIELLVPDGEQAGFSLAFDIFWRRPLRVGGGGLLQFGLRGATTSAGQSTLLNALALNGSARFKSDKTPGRWLTGGVSAGLEATERFDVVDLGLGAGIQWQLDFIPVRAMRRLVRRFTPYPMLGFEYNLVSRLKGEGEPEVLGRPDTEHRLRSELDWDVPMILETTLRVHLRADYLLSDVPAGSARWRTVHDVTLEYPLGLADDVALVVQWLDGRAAPTYQQVSRWLLGLGLRR